MIKKILITIAVVIAGIVGYAAIQPADYKVSRSAVIQAPAAKVFAQVNDFHKWNAWSPWAEKDPAAKMTFEGPASGKGAIARWDGNKEVGSGSMTILESAANERIHIQLEFLKPMKGTADTMITFAEEGKGKAPKTTTVEWTMTGKNNLIGRVFCLFMNMDKMVGGDFEKGLAAIKTVAEKA